MKQGIMSSVGTTVPIPGKEQVLPQGTQSPGEGESEKKKKNNFHVTMPQVWFEPTEARVVTYLNLVVRSTSKPPRLDLLPFIPC